MKTISFVVTGMHCESCELLIRSELGELKGVKNIHIDYKTGKSKDKLDLSDKEQLLLYQIASEEVFRDKVDELIYYYLDDGAKTSFVGSEKEKEAIKKKVIDIIEQIKTSDFAPNPQFHFCDFCKFKNSR